MVYHGDTVTDSDFPDAGTEKYLKLKKDLQIRLPYANIISVRAGMSELADEADSKSVDGNIVWVQVPLPAFIIIVKILDFTVKQFDQGFFCD